MTPPPVAHVGPSVEADSSSPAPAAPGPRRRWQRRSADPAAARPFLVAIAGGGAVAEAARVIGPCVRVGAGDIAEDLLLDKMLRDVADGAYSRGLAVLPSETFGSAAARLRDVTPPGLSCRRGLALASQEAVRLHTRLALRCARLAGAFEEVERPWCMVGEDVAPTEPTPFGLPEVAAITGSRKTNYLFLEEPGRHVSPMVRVVFGGVPFRANACDVLDCALSRWLRTRGSGVAAAPSMPQRPAAGSGASFDRVIMTTKLRGELADAKERREAEDAASRAGFRNTFDAVSRIPGHARLGAIMADLLEKLLSESRDIEVMPLQLAPGQLAREEVAAIESRAEPLLHLPRELMGKVLGLMDVGPIRTDDCDTCVRFHILHPWAQVAGDRGADVCRCIWEGAGAGMAVDPLGAGGRASNAKERRGTLTSTRLTGRTTSTRSPWQISRRSRPKVGSPSTRTSTR